MYEAVSCMAQRQLKQAAELLLDSVATFTTYELFSYEQCVFYAVSLAIVTLPRPELRKKVLLQLRLPVPRVSCSRCLVPSPSGSLNRESDAWRGTVVLLPITATE